MALDWVTVKDPNSDQTARVSRTAFERVWKDKGFTEVESDDPREIRETQKEAPAPAPVAPRPAPKPQPQG